jgi:uncharacterized protein (TIGR02246 family)
MSDADRASRNHLRRRIAEPTGERTIGLPGSTMTTTRLLAAMLACAAIPASSCQTSMSSGPDDEEALRALEHEWSNAGANADVEKFVSFYAEDASVLPPNQALVSGKKAIREMMVGLMSPGTSLVFEPTRVEVSQSGDLAFTRGVYTLTSKDPAGSLVTDRGKYIAVFQRQPDGQWKAIEDIFNSDLPVRP